jgi:hypothetical protein
MALSDELSGVLDTFVAWFDCVRHPYLSCEKILRARVSERIKITRALKLWLVGFIIHIILRIPALQHAGIDWSSSGFQLANTVLFLLALLLAAVLAHFGLRWRGIPSRFTETFVIYTVLLAVFLPLNTLLFYHTNFEQSSLLREIKVRDLGFFEALRFFSLFPDASRPLVFRVYQAITWPLFLASWSAFVVMFADLAGRLYKVERYRVITAFGLAFGVLFPIAIVPLAIFVAFLTLSFIR